MGRAPTDIFWGPAVPSSAEGTDHQDLFVWGGQEWNLTLYTHRERMVTDFPHQGRTYLLHTRLTSTLC